MSEEQTTDPRPPVEPPPFGAWRALKIVLGFLGVQLTVAIVVGVRAFLAGRGVKPAAPGADGVPIDLVVTALGAAFVGTLLAGLVALVLVRRAFAAPGGDAVRASVGWRRASAAACARAALVGLGLAAAYIVLGAFVHTEPRSMGPLARAASAGGVGRFLWAALAIGVAPPTEELLFRGVLYAGLARSWGARWAALVTTAIFVALHATEIGHYAPGWVVIAALGALALRARVVTGSLLPAIALHAGYNLALVLVVYAR